MLSALVAHASKRVARKGCLGSSIAQSSPFGIATRNISIGTNLTDSEITLQKARPWHMNDKDSNLAKDNALTMTDLFRGKTVALFGIPAPFTGTCTTAHYPAYQKLQDKFFNVGADAIVCYSVADPYSHYNWAKSMGNDFDKISFLADVDGEWARSHDLERDFTATSLGYRSARFSMVVEDGIVKVFNRIEKDASEDAQTLLEQLAGTGAHGHWSVGGEDV